MSLFYPKIKLESTMKIWNMNLERTKRLRAQNLEIQENHKEDILDFAKKNFKELKEAKSTWKWPTDTQRFSNSCRTRRLGHSEN